MPLRVYDNNAWQSPTSIRIYNDSEWKTASVGYVYDMGMWRIVFPDPIIPSISLALGPISTRTSVYTEFDLINSDYIIVQLFAGSNQSNLLQSQTIDTNHNITDREAVTFNGLSSDTTYNIKVTAYSITENTAVFLTGTFTTPPSVNLTATPYSDLSGASVSWVTTRQSRWRVIIRRTSDQSEVYRSSLDLQTGTISSVNALFGAIANTQYTVQLDLEFTGGGVATEYVNFTTPNVVQPSITSLSASSTCSTITANWTGSNYVSADIELWEVFFSPTLGQWELSSRLQNPAPYGTSTTSHTFTGLPSQQVYGLLLTLTSSTGQSITSTTYLGQVWITSTQEPSVTTPTNFTATSNFYGNGATLSWSASTGNCTSVTGYNVQYKLSSSGTWLTLVSGITATSANTTLYVTLTANTSYDFRVQATGSGGFVSGYATTTITTNNAPHNIFLYTLPLSTTTFTAVSVIAQLRNINNQSVTNSGITVNFSASPSGRGTLSSTSATTGSNGQATVTFTPNATTGDITLSATSSGLVSGSWNLGVALSPGLTPSLSTARTNFGYDITVNNYDSSYTWGGSVTNGGFNFNGNWQTNFYTIVVPPINTSAPVASQTSTQVTCTQGTWNMNPTAQTTVTTNKTGYSQGSASVSNSPTGSITATDYTWYFNDGTIWGTGQTRNIGSLVRGRTIRCLVTVTRTGGNQASAFSNFITVPA